MTRKLHRTPRRPAFRPRLETLEDRLAPATLLAGFTEASVASGLSSATAMDFSPTGELWVLEQGGRAKSKKRGRSYFYDTKSFAGLLYITRRKPYSRRGIRPKNSCVPFFRPPFSAP